MWTTPYGDLCYDNIQVEHGINGDYIYYGEVTISSASPSVLSSLGSWVSLGRRPAPHHSGGDSGGEKCSFFDCDNNADYSFFHFNIVVYVILLAMLIGS